MEAIRQLVIRMLAKGNKSGIVTTLPKKNVLDFQTMILAEKFMQNGIDPRVFKNADQAENMLKQLDEADKARASGITETESAKVFDLEGKEIPPGSKIMGGKAVDDLPPPGSRGGDEDIAAPILSSEETLKNMIMAENKQNIAAMKNRKMLDEAIDDASPGFANDIKYDAEIVAENLAERMGLVYDDLPTKQRLDLYDQAYTGLSKQRFKNKPEPEDKADGGRAGYKFGIGPIKKFFDFANKKSPITAYSDYLKNVKEKTLKANETGKFSDLPIAEVGLPAASGAFITQQVKKKLKSINKEETQKNKDKMFKEISEEYKQMYKDKPEFLEKMLLSLHENIYMDKKADGGRIGYKDGPKLTDFLNVQASGTKSGKQQIVNAPKGFTIDKETFNAIIKADIPLSEKIDFLASYQYGKGRDRIEKDDQELFLGEGGFKDRRIGLGFNKDGEGIGGALMYNMETGEPEFKLKFEKKFNKGGRVGYKVGGFDKARRAYLKMLGIGAGTTAAVKSGILKFSDAIAPKVIQKVPINSSTTSVPPPYFFELAEKIKKLGKPDKVTYQDRVEITRYTGKNGDEYELVEDLSTGDIQITKDKTGVGSYGDKSFDTIEDRTVLEYKKGQGDEMTKGTPADEYDEYKVEFDQDGTMAGADDMDAIVQKEIIEEAKGDAPSIKKAGGGIARMLGE